jgi:DNA invertase Pin-like site-specific DNA recombinase
MKAIGYIRVSTSEQATDGLSLGNQAEKIRAYCFAKGWELVDMIEDAGESAVSLNRPGMARIIELCQRREFEVLVIYKLDRMTRSVKDLGYLIQDVFEKCDVKFSSVMDNFDTSSANGKLILNILGSVAQWERDIIAERTKDALAHKKSKGERLGVVPFGFRLEDNRLVEDADEMRLLGTMKRMRRDGMSFQKIADKLNEKACPRPRRSMKWSKSTIADLINDHVKARKGRFLQANC